MDGFTYDLVVIGSGPGGQKTAIQGARELVRIAQVVMAHDGTVEYFINSVFNYPTLAECYKTAVFDGINRLHLYQSASRE